MTRWQKNEWYCVVGWALTFLAALVVAFYLTGCSAAATAKRDAELTANFAKCDTEAKAVARFASACSEALTQLLELMQQPECKDFPSSPADGGITIGGVTYICGEEVLNGRR